MQTSEVFENRASECEGMAKSARDPVPRRPDANGREVASVRRSGDQRQSVSGAPWERSAPESRQICPGLEPSSLSPAPFIKYCSLSTLIGT